MNIPVKDKYAVNTKTDGYRIVGIAWGRVAFVVFVVLMIFFGQGKM